MARLAVTPQTGETAATKAADAASETVSGKPVMKSVREKADTVIHYLTGAAMGGFYGLAGGAAPFLLRGRGSLFGISAWLLADEVAVPLLGFAPRPSRTKPADHILGIASHLVFGLTLDWCRRKLNQSIAAREPP
jgi:uncharacterized membrane protein YagU involved in acid resistance